MELFARTHEGARAYQVFEEKADAGLQARLGATLPRYDLRSLQESLAQLVDILEHELGRLANGQVHLMDGHRTILSSVHLDHPFEG